MAILLNLVKKKKKKKKKNNKNKKKTKNKKETNIQNNQNQNNLYSTHAVAVQTKYYCTVLNMEIVYENNTLYNRI